MFFTDLLLEALFERYVHPMPPTSFLETLEVTKRSKGKESFLKPKGDMSGEFQVLRCLQVLLFGLCSFTLKQLSSNKAEEDFQLSLYQRKTTKEASNLDSY
jgi:hypothetical protein